MKKIIILATALFGVLSAFGNELLDNGSFEEFKASSFMGLKSAEFTGWSFTNAWGKDVDSTDVLDGKVAFRTTSELKTKEAVLYQSIDCSEYAVADSFEMCICYKNLNDSTLRLCSYWTASAGGEALAHEPELEQELPYSAEWDSVVIRTAKPEGARNFEFRVEVKKKGLVLMDKLSFRYVEPIAPYFSVYPDKNYSFTTPIPADTMVATIIIRQYNLTQPVMLAFSGKGKTAYSIDKSQVTQAEDTVHVRFQTTAVGNYEAILNISDDESPETSLMNTSIAFKATAIDTTQAPTITITPMTFDTFRCKAYEKVTDTLVIKSENCYDYVHLVVDDETGSDWAFSLSESFFLKNQTDTVVITFAPEKEGTYTARYKAYTSGMDTLYFSTVGVASDGKPEPIVVDYDTVFVWKTDSPYCMLNETFDMGTELRNQTLRIPDWQNVVRKGTRAWWGFNSDSTQQAKMTSYCFQTDSGTVPFETWLVTPALDYTNAAKQIFAFNVMSDILYKGQTAKLELYYIDPSDPKDIFFQHIQSVDTLIPANNDELEGIWVPIGIDITGQPIANVFFMAFKFTDWGGNNGLTYYIDNVTWGFDPRTAVETPTAEAEGQTRKILRDGRLYILHNGKTYTIQGEKVNFR